MARSRLRLATLEDMDLLVRHRRGMWEAIGGFTERELAVADRAYRRWARTRLASGNLVGFVVETPPGNPVASGCVWVMPTQPRPRWTGTRAAYLMSMFTEPAQRGRGHAARIARASVRWARQRGFDLMTLHCSDVGRQIYEKEGFTRSREMRLDLRRRRRRPSQRTRAQQAILQI